jgi:hypothetical protein
MEGVESPNVKKAQPEESCFYAGVLISCCIIFGFGWFFGSFNFRDTFCKDDACKRQNNEILKIVTAIPGALGLGTSGGLTYFIKLYFDGKERQLRRETIKKRHELEREVPNEYRYSAEMDFLSVFYQKNNDIPDSAYKDFCQQIRGCCDSRGGIREKVKIYTEQHRYETSEQVLEGLKLGFFEDEHRSAPFYKLAKEACNHALKLELKTSEAWAEPFYDDIILYLDAWLRCSVRHGFAIPIRPFVLPLNALGKEAIGRYFEEESYIRAIKYIQENVLKDISILPFFRTQKSRDMVKDYLEKLVQLLEDEILEQTSQDDYLFYVS